jgi:mono/diheme cytochrome c family protein
MRKVLWFLLIFAACHDKKTADAPEDKGKKVYFANCIACHSADPSKDGTLGPAIKGSSKELIEARVLRAEYPPGYKPKRETKLMVALPHLKDAIDDLAAFLE